MNLHIDLANLPNTIVNFAHWLDYILVEEYDAQPDEIQYLDNMYDTYVRPTIDYDVYGVAFAKKYLLRNYWKTIFCFSRNPPVLSKKVVDIGCGSAAATLAYLALLEISVKDTFFVNFQLVDHSRIQLEIAGNILKKAKRFFNKVKFSYELSQIDYTCNVIAASDANLYLVVFAIPPQIAESDLIIQTLYSTVFQRQVYLIDRITNKELCKIEKFLLGSDIHYEKLDVTINPEHLRHSDIFDEYHLGNAITARILTTYLRN